MRERSFLGFDVGTRRMGVATGNEVTRSAAPLTTIVMHSGEVPWHAIDEHVRAWQPDELVVGMPRHPDGAPHDMTRLAARFVKQLESRYGKPVRTVDERYSSVEAARGLHTSGRATLDAAAAAVILQQHLDGLHAPNREGLS